MRTQFPEVDTLVTPAEVAALLAVDRKTVTRWAAAGKISWVQTPGGHRRYLKSEIVALVATAGPPKRARRHPAPASVTNPEADADGSTGPVPVATFRGQQLAAAVVAHAVVTAREAHASEATLAVLSNHDAAEAATTLVARAAEQARVRRSAAAAAAARAEAINAREAAATVQRQVEASAARWQGVADGAARIVAAASAPGGDREVALAALRLATTIQAAAVAGQQDAAAAAVGVAADVAVAAKRAAYAAAELDSAIEVEVMEVAEDLRTAADLAARQLAAQTAARATEAALVAREAVSAVSLLEDHREVALVDGPIATT